MSHTTKIDFEANDIDVLRETCAELGFGFAVNQSVKLFDGSQYEGCETVTIPKWRYPIVVKDGKLFFDNYNGSWGSPEKLDDLRQNYQAGVVIKQAKKKGMRVVKRKVGNEIKLMVSRT